MSTASAPVTLENCDREPIHIPGSIQPHGLLVAIDRQSRVMHISGNAKALIGVDAEAAVGQILGALFPEPGLESFLDAVTNAKAFSQPTYLRSVTIRETRFDAIAHRSGELTIIELEPTPDAVPDDVYALVQDAISQLRTASDLDTLSGLIAFHVRRITGFDRVMVYRFDRSWNGQVIAEEKRDGLEPFLGLHYPASDIPAQARELYRKNWLRFIADRDYVPSPLVPAISSHTGEPLDMSFAVLRSVSPIHLQYLRNMGVGASMSISLICDGQLWGLVACHHYAPKRIPYNIRTASELMGQVMSMRVATATSNERMVEMNTRRRRIDEIIGRMNIQDGLVGLIDGAAGEVCSLLGLHGVALVQDRQLLRSGQTPSTRDILEIADHLRRQPRAGAELLHTDSVRDWVQRGTIDAVAAGVIAISFTPDGSRMLLGFRPEKRRTVNWAGDPEKTVSKSQGEARLSPRGSFALWQQEVEGMSLPWTDIDLQTADELRKRCTERLAAYAEQIERHNQMLRRHGDEKDRMFETERAARMEVERLSRLKDDFVATLSHELRTPLNAIHGWTQLLQATTGNDANTKEALDVIERNTRSQMQLIEDLLDMSRITSGKLQLNVEAVDLPSTIEAAIETVQIAADAKDIRLVKFLDPLDGLAVTGDAQRLQQVFWNLLSNAVKFSPKHSRIRIELKRINSHIEVSFRDNGIGIKPEFLPYVFDRFRQSDQAITRQQRGLGLGLAIARNIVELHGGTISAFSPGENQGSVFAVTLPVRAMTDHHEENASLTNNARHVPHADLRGLRLLVVEDEQDSRDLMRRLLARCGAEVTVAGTAAEALRVVYESAPFDAMVSDIGLPGEDGFFLLSEVRKFESRTGRTRMPVVAVTAYAGADDRRRILLSGFQMHIGKPAEPGELCAAVASLTGRVA